MSSSIGSIGSSYTSAISQPPPPPQGVSPDRDGDNDRAASASTEAAEASTLATSGARGTRLNITA